MGLCRWMLLLLLVFLLQIALLTGAAEPLSLPVPVLGLQRTVHLKATAVRQLTQLDIARHEGRGLFDATGVVQLPGIGSSSTGNYAVPPYLTRVKLGNPAKDFTLLVDTGSDTVWFACSPCSGCPVSSGTSQREFYDPWSSSTSSVIGCSDTWCRDSIRNGIASCDSPYSQHGLCGYNLIYGSGASKGYYVSDIISLATVAVGGSTNFSASIIFGCNDMQSGGLTQGNLPFDGIIGIGPNRLSLNSQLNSLGISPMVFSLCLGSSGNGILLLGEAVHPGLIYTPLIKSKFYYSVNLESISVDGVMLPIDSSVFTSDRQKTIVDSGTTLTFLADEAYDPFINAILAAVSPSVQTTVGNDGGPCFVTSGSLEMSFPPVTLNFVSGAAMKLKPHNYLLREALTGDRWIFCIGWKRQQEIRQITIIGDIVLMDKLVVHDLDNMRLGWVDYNCSGPVNVTNSHQWKSRHEKAGASYTCTMLKLILVAAFLTHILTFCV